MILADSIMSGLGIAIPIIVVFGIFVVRPLAYRRSGYPPSPSRRWGADSKRLDAIVETQTQVLAELQAMRAKLDEVDRVLASVE
jgi:hypothetical protein